MVLVSWKTQAEQVYFYALTGKQKWKIKMFMTVYT